MLLVGVGHGQEVTRVEDELCRKLFRIPVWYTNGEESTFELDAPQVDLAITQRIVALVTVVKFACS